MPLQQVADLNCRHRRSSRDEECAAPCRASKNTVAILAGLQAAYPHPERPEHEALHELLGATNEHVIRRAAALLRASDAQQIGALP